ncbi:MAG: type II toxin-antitoxin system HicB family antitoxin [Dehalococcoidia bacterium]
MQNVYSAIVELGDDGWFIAQSPEVPGANGQGRTPQEAIDDLRDAITLVHEYLKDEAARLASGQALQTTVAVG